MERKDRAEVKVVHFADPWCWWSWGLEPVLQRLREVYGDHLKVEYRMGGTFEDIHEWMKEYGVDEASAVDWIRESVGMFRNPLYPEYLRKSGVTSTYPACLAYKAAQRQDPEKADKFFRRMMEAFQVQALPGTDETLLRLAREVGLDGPKLLRDARSKAVGEAFEADRREMEKASANFLTLLVSAGGRIEAKSEVFTSGPFEEIIDRLQPGLPKRAPADILEYLEKHADPATTHEVAEVFHVADEDAERRLAALEKAGVLARSTWAGASFWTAKELQMEKLPLDVVKISHVPPEAHVEAVTDLTPIVTAAVQHLYTEVAQEPRKEYHFPLGLEALRFVGYPEADLKELPATATESFAGVGYPFATRSIRSGDTVLDIGSGSGTDVLYASLKVGPKGRVMGLDFTPAMIAKARANIERMGAKQVTIVEGNATKIPLPDASVDVVTSNGVLNLVPDKPAAFREIFRVLKPAGRLQLADIVVQEDVGAVCGLNPQLWADCIGGAAVEAEYLQTIHDAGFEDVEVVKRVDYFSKSSSDSTKRITKSFGAESVVLSARKPEA
ncbi:MAG TPA: methyltransferase domain-containing protein [Thermoplasmata archaeon]|nr:methyltransferase domain-containing protein [Thermoplasmata archaeon]